MKCAVIGFVSGTDFYTDKVTKEVRGTVAVASGMQMLRVRTPLFRSFKEGDKVLTVGDAQNGKTEIWFKPLVIRLATDTDLAMFADADEMARAMALEAEEETNGADTE